MFFGMGRDIMYDGIRLTYAVKRYLSGIMNNILTLAKESQLIRAHQWNSTPGWGKWQSKTSEALARSSWLISCPYLLENNGFIDIMECWRWVTFYNSSGCNLKIILSKIFGSSEPLLSTVWISKNELLDRKSVV